MERTNRPAQEMGNQREERSSGKKGGHCSERKRVRPLHPSSQRTSEDVMLVKII